MCLKKGGWKATAAVLQTDLARTAIVVSSRSFHAEGNTTVVASLAVQSFGLFILLLWIVHVRDIAIRNWQVAV